MRKERKVNIIRGLKQELSIYKQKTAVKNVELISLPIELKHLRIQKILSPEEVVRMPKEAEMDLPHQIILQALKDSIKDLPVEVEFDGFFGVWKVSLDMWVK